MNHKRTVCAKWLNTAADQLERDANQSLNAWIILGQTDRYSTSMAKVRAMRHAAEIKNIGVRREYLRNSGIDV